MRARYVLYPLINTLLDAKRQGHHPRVRFTVHGDLTPHDNQESQAKQDFAYITRELTDKLRIAQGHLPEPARHTPTDVGLIATPQFLPAIGPTRIHIWIDTPDPPTDPPTPSQ